MTVNNTVPPTVNDPTQEFCVINNSTVADLSANGINILWYSQATGGIPLAVNTSLTNGVYYASQNDGTCESSTRTQVTVTITDSNPPTGQSTQSFCAIDTPTLAQVVLAGENIKWFAFQNGGAELPLSTQLINGADYFASQTPSSGNQCESSTRFKVTVTVQSPESLRVQDNTQVFCRNVGVGKIPTVANLDAEATVPGSPIVWYDALIGGNQFNPTDELVNGSYFGSQIVNGCESIPRVEVVVSLECRVVAQDDLVENANGVVGVVDILNVIDNDNSEGDPINLNVFVLTLTNPLDPTNPLTLDVADGTVDLAPNTPAGEYTLGYTITQIGTPSNTDSAVITVRVNPRPDITISKTASSTQVGVCGVDGHQVGDEVTFTINVTNSGLDTATNVKVIESLPTGYKYDSYRTATGTYDGVIWTIGSLNAGATATLEVDAIIQASGNYSNSVIVSATELDSDTSNNTSLVDIRNTIIPVTDLKVDYKVNNSSPFVGDIVTFTLRVTNDGPSNATSVVAESLLPKGYFVYSTNPSSGVYDTTTGFWSIGNLANGGSETLTITAGVLARLASDTDQIYKVRGCVNGVECDSNSNNDCIDVDITPKPSANLVVSIGVNDTTPYVGDQVVFEMFVENLGPSIATDVELTLTLPEGHTYVSHTFKDNVLDSGLYDSTTGKWLVGTMDPSVFQASPILQVTTTTNPKKTSYTAVAETWCNEEQPFGHPNHNPASDITNNRDQVTTSPFKRVDLKMDKQIDNNTVSVGEQVTFILTVTNPVDLSDATGVVVVDPIPSGYTYVSDTSGGAYDPLTGIWTIGNLVSNTGSVSIDIVASVNVTGNYTNTATVTSVEDEKESTDNASSVTPTVEPNSDLSVQVSVSSSVVKLYDQITYTITVTNNGLSDATGVVMTDVLPAEFSYLSDDSGGAYDLATGAFSIGNLVVNATSTIKILGVISGVANEYKEEKIVNTVSVAGTEFDKNLINNTAQVEITYVPDCEVRVYNFVSANGDGKNDYFQIDNIDCYTNSIEIFNRWGSLVYEADNYESSDSGNGKVFKGISEGSGTVGSEDLPSGTYFYILKYNDGIQDREQTGYIQLTR